MERFIPGKITRQQYQPQEPTMTVEATTSEIIALGHVITQYLHQSERTPKKTKEQLEIEALLRSFQGRLAAQAHHQRVPPPGMRGMKP